MPTYEYQCDSCGFQFERLQPITAQPISECPECQGQVRRLVSSGVGFVFKGSGQGRITQGSSCSLEQTGTTCCGQASPCGTPSCEEG
ncbi:MAG: zinc ribbon domain-containing protein [Calditrichaeota bacterium]|nr:zinc ribbon domain-containing protein [Calditrichota bacterium]